MSGDHEHDARHNALLTNQERFCSLCDQFFGGQCGMVGCHNLAVQGSKACQLHQPQYLYVQFMQESKGSVRWRLLSYSVHPQADGEGRY